MKARVGLEYPPLTGKNGIGLFLERQRETNSMKGTLLKMELILIFWSHFFFLVYQKELFHSMKMKR